jgi:hypothetical protein
MIRIGESQMMRAVLIAALLAFSVSANASHHRGHAIGHLDNTILRLTQSIAAARLYRDQDAIFALPEDQLAEWKGIDSAVEPLWPKASPEILEGRQNAARAAWANDKRTQYPEYEGAYIQLLNSNKYVIYGNKYLHRIIAARELLATGGDLDTARRLINSPGPPNELESSLWGMWGIQSIWTVLVREDLKNYQRWRGVNTLERKATQSINWALWHINDGIREEIYFDPTFICSGPNNGCE